MDPEARLQACGLVAGGHWMSLGVFPDPTKNSFK